MTLCYWRNGSCGFEVLQCLPLMIRLWSVLQADLLERIIFHKEFGTPDSVQKRWDEECVQLVAKDQIEKTQLSCNSVLLEMLSSSSLSSYNCADQKTAENIKHSFQKQKPHEGSKYVHDFIHILNWHRIIVSERSWESIEIVRTTIFIIINIIITDWITLLSIYLWETFTRSRLSEGLGSVRGRKVIQFHKVKRRVLGIWILYDTFVIVLLFSPTLTMFWLNLYS